MRWSIRYRLLFPLALLLSGLVAASLWSASVAAHRAESRVAHQVSDISATLTNARFPLTAPVLEQMKQLSGAEFFLSFQDGRRLTTFNPDSIELPLPNNPVDQINQLGPAVAVAGRGFRVNHLELKEPHPQAGTQVYVFYPESLLQEVIADAVRPSFLGLLFGFITVGLTSLLANRLVRRIRSLEKHTRRIAQGDFSTIALPNTNDELRDLAVSVNEMSNQLAKFQQTIEKTERLRLANQLATGLAHQLRNGVTGAQLALDISLADESHIDKEAITVAKRQLTMIDVNLRRFMDFNRTEISSMLCCDLSAVVREVTDLFQAQCRHANIKLKMKLEQEPILITGHSSSLNDIVTNLVGNAIEAVGQNGDILVSLKVAGQQIELQISDSGSGPPKAIADHLFEPFVTGKPEGIGLGLAVVKQTVESHHGTISWKRENHRTVFRVLLPYDPLLAKPS